MKIMRILLAACAVSAPMAVNAFAESDNAVPGISIAIGDGASWRIDQVEPDPNSDGELYYVSIVDAEGARPLCPGEDGRNRSALPLEGAWDDRGVWSPEGVTFACHDGVLAKCVRWGYAPWSEHDGQSLRAHHQACTRMARADYCGDGVPHTQDGTLINFWDSLGVQISDPGDDLTFEAAWTPGGAFNIERTRYPEDMAYVAEHCPERLASGTTTGEALFWNESIPH